MELLIASLVGVSGVLGVVLIGYSRTLRELNRWRKGEEAEKLMSAARRRAMDILEGAKTTALQIMEKAQVEATTTGGVMGEEVKRVTDEELKEYKLVLQNISKGIESGAMRELEDFKKVLETETVEVQKSVAEKVEQKYKEVSAEIEKYKADQIQSLNNHAGQIIKDVVFKVIGKLISPEEHAQLITAALEEAKKQHVV